jgi:hypothetical protein
MQTNITDIKSAIRRSGITVSSTFKKEKTSVYQIAMHNTTITDITMQHNMASVELTT